MAAQDLNGSPKVKGEIVAEADVARRRILIRLLGHVTTDTILAANANIRTEMGKLSRPYDCITDVTELAPLSEDAAHLFRELLRGFVSDMQIRHFIRVVGRAVQAATQFERASRGAGFEAHLAFTVEEAHRMLDELAKRSDGATRL